jgi:hypothetical protein
MDLVRIINGPPASQVIGWVCEVIPTFDGVVDIMDALGHGELLKLRTCDETMHPEGYFYVYKRNTVDVGDA